MPGFSRRFPLILPAVLALAAAAVSADVRGLVKDLFPLPAVTGNEMILAAKIAALLPRTLTVETEGLGSLTAGSGSGGPAVLAALDEFGYVVSGFTADGYLTLDRAVAPPIPIADSFLLGHPVVIGTKTGPVIGIVSQPAMHLLTRERRDQLAKDLTLDLIFVDVGVRSEAEARAKGVEILDPVTFRQDLVSLAGDRLAGPSIGQKSTCAALLAVALDSAKDKTPRPAQFVWMAQSRFPARGVRASLGALRAKTKLAPKTAIILDVIAADRGEKSPVFGKGIVVIQAKDAPSKLRQAIDDVAQERKIPLQYRSGMESPLLAPFLADGCDAVVLALPARYAGTPAEIIDLKDVQALADLVAAVLKTGRLL
jgi:endoglucanase